MASTTPSNNQETGGALEYALLADHHDGEEQPAVTLDDEEDPSHHGSNNDNDESSSPSNDDDYCAPVRACCGRRCKGSICISGILGGIFMLLNGILYSQIFCTGRIAQTAELAFVVVPAVLLVGGFCHARQGYECCCRRHNRLYMECFFLPGLLLEFIVLVHLVRCLAREASDPLPC